MLWSLAGEDEDADGIWLPKLQVALTKCDLVSREDLAKCVVVLRSDLSSLVPWENKLQTLMLSASRGQGLMELKKELGALFIRPTV